LAGIGYSHPVRRFTFHVSDPQINGREYFEQSAPAESGAHLLWLDFNRRAQSRGGVDFLDFAIGERDASGRPIGIAALAPFLLREARICSTVDSNPATKISFPQRPPARGQSLMNDLIFAPG